MTRFDPTKLRSLLEVDRRGSIAAAARALHLTPSAVSQHLSTLERMVRAELLHRSARGTQLTPAGRVMVRHAATIEDALDSIAHDLAAPEAQFDLKIGYVQSIAPVLASAIADLADQSAGCSIRTVETSPEDARRAVLLGDLDAALTVDWPHHPQPRSLELNETILLIEPLLIAHAGPLHGEGLNRFEKSTWVAAPAASGCGTALRNACRKAGFEPDIHHETNDFAAAVALAATTGSATIIPSVLRPVLPRGVTTAATPGLTRDLLLLSRRNLTPVVRSLEAHLARRLANLSVHRAANHPSTDN
jgi:molybdate transport repressor ModE-like protein